MGKIDWTGKIKSESIEADASCNEFADFIAERCYLPTKRSNYNDIQSNIFNPTSDGKITEDEVFKAGNKMKRGSKSKCGIPLPLFMLVINSIITPMTFIFNKIFISSYPTCWSTVIMCLPKKGKLNIPNLRGIGLKKLFAKVYDTILQRRLER